MDNIYKGIEKINGELYNVNDKPNDERRPFKACLDIGLSRATIGNRVFGAMKGACDAGIYIPHTGNFKWIFCFSNDYNIIYYIILYHIILYYIISYYIIPYFFGINYHTKKIIKHKYIFINLERKFPGFIRAEDAEEKDTYDPKIHREKIYGVHIDKYMKELKENQEDYNRQFSIWDKQLKEKNAKSCEDLYT